MTDEEFDNIEDILDEMAPAAAWIECIDRRKQ